MRPCRDFILLWRIIELGAAAAAILVCFCFYAREQGGQEAAAARREFLRFSREEEAFARCVILMGV